MLPDVSTWKITEFRVLPTGCVLLRKSLICNDKTENEVVFNWRTVVHPSLSIDTSIFNDPTHAALARTVFTPDCVAAYEASLIMIYRETEKSLDSLPNQPLTM